MDLKLRKRLVLLIALMSYLLTALDSSLVLTSLTKIQASLGLNQVTLSWIQDAYGLAFGSFILISGRLGDMYGRKKMMITALTLFWIGSIITGSSNIAMLTIISRFFEGMGASIMAPTALALLIDYFSGSELTKAIAWYSSIAGLGMSIGLILGGVFAGFLNWRVGFFVDALIAVLLLVLSVIALENKNLKALDARVDLLGAVLSILGSGLLVYAVNGAKKVGLFLIIALIVLTAFVLYERKAQQPVMPLHLLHNRTRILAYLSRGVLVAAAMGFSFFNSEYLQDSLNYSPLQAGFAYLPMTVTLFVTAMLVSRFIDSLGNRRVLMFGSISIMLSFGWAFFSGTHSFMVTILVPELLLGIGQGLVLAPQTNLGIYKVDPQEAGAASSVLNMFHQLGGVLGIAVMVQAGLTIKPVHGIANQFNEAMFVGFVLAIIAVVVAWFARKEE
ncbi:MAG: MFS transporter [Limosilactobacillus coleohominis]|uniref:MFS transporter n=1 Tax=Limosilactobacillus coleohominis TaxID=181675 RepID=UPI002A813FE8|nr:MFS transporter [Limosilactobacillus coleohominis]MCI5812034.1 MFS transporter [Lactobacillus sp.]MDY3703173.1 MFS transporter [Limosilactobacillus coleohominis]MDY5628736.1 MFS transporter [Limosilactobacillus coleohominis]